MEGIKRSDAVIRDVGTCTAITEKESCSFCESEI
jgi:hypothetical protein